VDAVESKGITQSMVALRATSAFCFHGLPFTPKSGSAVIDYGGVINGDTELAELEIAHTGFDAADCNAGEGIEVATSSSPGTFAPEPFYVVLYG
jgi:hypothetical protein